MSAARGRAVWISCCTRTFGNICRIPLRALDDWVRVVKPDGFIFAIVPKRDADPLDRPRPLTAFAEWEEHYAKRSTYEDRIAEMKGPARSHYTVFSPELLQAIEPWFNRAHSAARLEEVAFQETDDKVGNGHTIVWRVRKVIPTAQTVEGSRNRCWRYRARRSVTRTPVRDPSAVSAARDDSTNATRFS